MPFLCAIIIIEIEKEILKWVYEKTAPAILMASALMMQNIATPANTGAEPMNPKITPMKSIFRNEKPRGTPAVFCPGGQIVKILSIFFSKKVLTFSFGRDIL